MVQLTHEDYVHGQNNREHRVLKSEGFLDLSVQLVRRLVQETELQVDETNLFAAVQAWVERDPSERRRHVDEVRRGHKRTAVSVVLVVVILSQSFSAACPAAGFCRDRAFFLGEEGVLFMCFCTSVV